jgi:hypothetical protein
VSEAVYDENDSSDEKGPMQLAYEAMKAREIREGKQKVPVAPVAGSSIYRPADHSTNFAPTVPRPHWLQKQVQTRLASE